MTDPNEWLDAKAARMVLLVVVVPPAVILAALGALAWCLA